MWAREVVEAIRDAYPEADDGVARRAAAAGLEPAARGVEGRAGPPAHRAGERREALPRPLAGQPARADRRRARPGQHLHRRRLHGGAHGPVLLAPRGGRARGALPRLPGAARCCVRRRADPALGAALADVRERIARAAAASGRAPESVTLMAVTKTQPMARDHGGPGAGRDRFRREPRAGGAGEVRRARRAGRRRAHRTRRPDAAA